MKYVYFLIDESNRLDFYTSRAKVMSDQKRYGGTVVRHVIRGVKSEKPKTQTVRRQKRKSA